MKNWIVAVSAENQDEALKKLKQLTEEFERLTILKVPVKKLYLRENNNLYDCHELN